MLEERLLKRLKRSHVRVDVPDGDTVFLRNVPSKSDCFNKSHTNLLIKRAHTGMPYLICVDEDLEYTGADQSLLRAFTAGHRQQGWRVLFVEQDAQADFQRVVERALDALGFDRQEPVLSLKDEREKNSKRKSLLASFGRNISEECMTEVEPTVGRAAEISEVVSSLLQWQLKFTVVAGNAGVGKTNLLYGVARESFARLKSQGMHGVYVMRDQDTKSFRATDDLFIIRARKNKGQELSRLLLGQTKIPVFSGDYTSAGRLVQGVEALLNRAVKSGDRNIYIIGTEEKVFNELWEKAEAKTSQKRRSGKDGSHQETLDQSMTPQHLLELLPHCDIPDELARTYIGDSLEAQLVRHLIMRAASHAHPVLITGNTGTGKEVVARMIHKYSDRAARSFVPLNCGAIPRELLEAELFGAASGVATNVRERAGLWEITGRGTLFLDEIGDLSPDHQVKILRALQEKKIRRIGEAKERDVHARVLAATNRDLFSMVQAGQFREDLYYRLRSFLIHTPSLKNHPDDARTLSQFLWKKITHNERAALSEEILAKLASYAWPGNVREIKAVLMNIYTLFGGERLSIEQLDAVLQLQGHGAAREGASSRGDEINLHRVECLRHLRRVDEVIRACEVALKPIIEDGKREEQAVKFAQSLLGQRLNELELLCLRRLLFHSEVTFSVIYRLKGKLSYFYSFMEKDAGQAVSYWKGDVMEESKLALSAIFREVEQITTR